MTLNSRQFTGSLGVLKLSAMLGNAWSGIKDADNRVDSISLYLVNVTKARNFSHSTWHNRQHIFIGKGAAWVEVIEKPLESDVLLKCVTISSTKINSKGAIELIRKKPGFGLSINKNKLKKTK